MSQNNYNPLKVNSKAFIFIAYIFLGALYYILGKLGIYSYHVSLAIKFAIIVLFFAGSVIILYYLIQDLLNQNKKIKVAFVMIFIVSIAIRLIVPIYTPRWMMLHHFYSFDLFTPLDSRAELSKLIATFLSTPSSYATFYTILGSLVSSIALLTLYNITKNEKLSILSALFLSINPWWLLTNRTLEYSNLALFYLATMFYGISRNNLAIVLLSMILGSYSRPEFCIFLPATYVAYELLFNEEEKNFKRTITSITAISVSLIPFYLYVLTNYHLYWDYVWFGYYATTILDHLRHMRINLHVNLNKFIERYLTGATEVYIVFWFYFLSTLMTTLLYGKKYKKLVLFVVYWFITFLFYMLFGQGIQNIYRFSLNNAFSLFLVSPISLILLSLFIDDFYKVYSQIFSGELVECAPEAKSRYLEFMDANRIRNSLNVSIPIVVERHSLFPYYLGVKNFKFLWIPQNLNEISRYREFYLYLDCYFANQDNEEGIRRYDMESLLKNVSMRCMVRKIYERNISCSYGLYYISCK